MGSVTNVEVLGGVQRHRDARHAPDLARPDPAQFTTNSQVTSPAAVFTPATRPFSTRIAVTAVFSRIVAPPCRAPRASASVVSIGWCVRRGAATGPRPDRRAHERPAAPRLRGRDDLDVHVEAARHRGETLQLVHALPIPREAHAAGAAEAGGLPGLRLEPLVEIGAVLGEPGEILRRAKLADEPAACQVVPQEISRRSSSSTSRQPSVDRW